MSKEINFTISEFIITGDEVPIKVADKLLKFHITPMLEVREELGIPLYPSQRSGYRPISWEIKKGRSGNSQHTFMGKGAVDWTCNNFSSNREKLLISIIKNTSYNRITLYPTFIHCDYKDTNSGKREYYTSGMDSKWKFIKTL